MAEPTFRFSPRPNRAHEILWREWGETAFAEAKSAQKPLLLAISGVWCHWCHVMDETTYSDPQIIARINQDFIPIRVDNDQRPDINQRYNMGGWPTTAFLTPAGEVITGGTYFAPEQMRSLLDQVLQYWMSHMTEIADKVVPPAAPALNTAAAAPENAVIAHIMDTIRQQFDRAYGGIGIAPKFPHPEVWELALTRFTATGDGWSAGMAVRTLDAMAGGGLYDALAGGFFRYSTTREWTVPHFEKMLEDNALLARLYLRAYQILGDESYRQVADGVLQWANRTLLNPQGLWGGSQDADEEYYRLPKEERDRRPQPFVDPVIYTNWNSYMVSAQLLAASLINPPVYTPVALTALEALWDRMWDPGQGLYHFDNGRPQLLGLLTDVAALGQALLDGYEFTGDGVYVDRARQLAEYADRHLYEAPAYFDQPPSPDPVGRLRHRQQPLPENALMARFLHRLGELSDDPARIERAAAILGAFSDVAREQGVFAAGWALAADRIEAPELSATVVQSPHRPGGPLRQAMFGVFDRHRVLRTVAAGTRQFAEAGYPELPMPALYLCRGQACAAPVSAPEDILRGLQQLVSAVPAASEPSSLT